MTGECPKELTQQKAASPGTVSAGESIVYILLDPDQWKDGKLTNAAFSKSRLANGDLSVARADHSTAEEAYEQIIKPQLQRDARRTLVGALRARCADIRAITVGNPAVRAICVIDDGFDGYRAHALLAYSDATNGEEFWKRNSRIAVRANLSLVFGEQGGPLPLAECF